MYRTLVPSRYLGVLYLCSPLNFFETMFLKKLTYTYCWCKMVFLDLFSPPSTWALKTLIRSIRDVSSCIVYCIRPFKEPRKGRKKCRSFGKLYTRQCNLVAAIQFFPNKLNLESRKSHKLKHTITLTYK